MLTPFKYLSPVIQKLMIINAVIFVIGFFLGPYEGIFTWALSLTPSILTKVTPEFWFGKPWSIFTYMFVHGSFFHLFANMFFGLWMFGDSVARDIGDKHFLKLYLLAGVFAGALSAVVYIVFQVPISGIVGASGATYAIMYLFCRNNPQATVYFMFVIPMKVKTLFIVLLVFEGVGAIKNIAPQLPSDGIAHVTHLLGLLGGFLYMKYLYNGVGSGSRFQGSQESTFSHFADRVKKGFGASDKKEKEYDKHSPHGSNEMLDTVLKKVSDYGVNALTEKEKQFLEKVSEERRKQKGTNIHNMDDYR